MLSVHLLEAVDFFHNQSTSIPLFSMYDVRMPHFSWLFRALCYVLFQTQLYKKQFDWNLQGIYDLMTDIVEQAHSVHFIMLPKLPKF